jgi:diadenosine tetraphosphate (Ap4A) HIT family hydrolase
MRVVLVLAAGLIASVCPAELHTCGCDAAKPETLESRECSLDRAARDDTSTGPYLFLKDINPTKPNRTIALPRANAVRLAEMTPDQRIAFWSAAIAKSTALWGDQWGVAMNGEKARTQCHIHVHLGQLKPDAEQDGGVTVDGPADIPLPEADTGMWVHAVGGKLHVHAGQQINETVLIR